MYRKGTIILVPFPFTDLAGNKIRSAVVLFNHKKSGDIVVVFIASNTKQEDLFDVKIEPSILNRIKVESKIVCAKIATVDRKIIVGKIGECDIEIMKKVNNNLRTVLGL